MSIHLPPQEQLDDLEAIKMVRTRVIFTKKIFLALLVIIWLAVMTHQLEISPELFVGVVAAMIGFEIGLMRYDYLGSLIKLLDKKTH